MQRSRNLIPTSAEVLAERCHVLVQRPGSRRRIGLLSVGLTISESTLMTLDLDILYVGVPGEAISTVICESTVVVRTHRQGC